MGLFDNYSDFSVPGFGGSSFNDAPAQSGFPANDFRMGSFSNFMQSNPLQGLMPQTQSYMGMMNEMPQRDDYSSSPWRKIAALLAGTAAGLGNPNAGAQVAGGIANAPYLNDMNDFQRRFQMQGQAANQEQGLLGIASKLYGDEYGRNVDAQKLGLQRVASDQAGSKISNDFTLGQEANQIKKDDMEIQRQQIANQFKLGLMNAGNGATSAAASMMNARTNQEESQSPFRMMAPYISALASMGRSDQGNQPNASYSALQINQALQSNPATARYYDADNGRFDYESLAQDPQALQVYRSVQSQYMGSQRNQGNPMMRQFMSQPGIQNMFNNPMQPNDPLGLFSNR